MQSPHRKKLSEIDISSGYALIVGLSTFTISVIVAIVTFIKIVSGGDISVLAALLISLIVFYIFYQVYSYILFLGLKYFKRNQNKL